METEEDLTEKLKIFFERTEEGIIFLKNGRCILANPAATRILKLTKEELLKKKFVELFPESEHAQLEKILLDKVTVVFESKYFLPREKKNRTLKVTIHPYLKEEKETRLHGQIAFIQDISKIKQLLKNLHDSEEIYRTIVENSLEGMIIVDNNYQFIFVNDEFARMLKTTREELLGKDFRNFLAEESLELVAERYQRRQKGEKVPKRYELIIKRADGKKRHALISSTVFRNAEGEIQTLALLLDISKRKKTEKALVKSEQEFRLIFESSMDAIFWADPETGKIINCNKAAERLLERGREEIVGKQQTILHPPGRQEQFSAMFQRHYLQEGTLEDEGEIITKSGKIIPVLITATVVKIGERKIIQGIFKDIAKRKEAEEELRKLNEELEIRVNKRTKQLRELNKELEAFAYSVSHDLRAPLRSISGFSKIVREEYTEVLDEKGKDFLERIDKATKQMEKLINALLELSRLTRAEMQITKVNLSAIVKGIINELQREEPERKVEIRIEENIEVNGDKQLLKTMMRNLIENAWKFTRKKKKAKIIFGTEEREGERIYYLEDNGVGFNMRYKDKLFQVFQRLHANEDFPGVGVGLANVQRIVKKHGGEIWAESKEGEGTTFYFKLLAEKAKETTL